MAGDGRKSWLGQTSLVAYCLLLVAALATVDYWGPRLVTWTGPGPAEVTCLEWVKEPGFQRSTAMLVAEDFDRAGLSRSAVEDVIRQEIDTTCAKSDGSHRPVNGDLRGEISSELRRLEAR